MLQAKPTAHDYEAVRDYLAGLECIFDHRTHPESETGNQEITEAEAFAWLEKNYRRFDLSIDRVVNSGEVAINNACDPSVDHLALKPELKNAAAQRDDLLAACKALLPLVADCICHGMPITPEVAHARNIAVAAVAKCEATP